MKAGKQFWALMILLVAGGVVINFWHAVGESRVERRPLRELPETIGGWRRMGPDGRFDQATEAILRADDYVNRDYAAPDGRAASLYVGYYSTQRTGATYHSPLNCLPGSGWEMVEPTSVAVTPANGAAAFTANSYVVKRAGERQLLVYGYLGRGRAVASDYWDKVYTVIDSVLLRRSDGAMVRVLVPVRGSDQDASSTALAFAAEVAPKLSAFVPD